jgi:hypothetical protein
MQDKYRTEYTVQAHTYIHVNKQIIKSITNDIKFIKFKLFASSKHHRKTRKYFQIISNLINPASPKFTYRYKFYEQLTLVVIWWSLRYTLRWGWPGWRSINLARVNMPSIISWPNGLFNQLQTGNAGVWRTGDGGLGERVLGNSILNLIARGGTLNNPEIDWKKGRLAHPLSM